MRDYSRIDSYLNELDGDIYAQPSDPMHAAWATQVIQSWIPNLKDACKTVLDVGCGQGFCKTIFEKLGTGIIWRGVTLGEDFVKCMEKGLPVNNYDMTFLDSFADESFDLVFARHVLEHSPMPLITLMEWHRVARNWLCLVLPRPIFWSYVGLNHYAVMDTTQVMWLLSRAGWHPIWDAETTEEYRFMCEKKIRKSPR
jgi:ubiquinone/menaquinone biosynthesis C-methylase UbiE